ncbi:DUF4340 domain-containing protein [Thalassotalea profundi]|uniref:DUF4340 domain-containing protein n=1 Tax=Thalassotalea profundi TaxID=2036687 RepID=A0ABQ3J1R6_9GAMM|nr:DUF4340 domain-containing protein [Thalassotalea profundi]GHF01035.1 hypothetical protein GCM10011501_33160 [Thalassotalea profundi]
MNKQILVLTAFLTLQLALAGILFFNNSNVMSSVESRFLIAVDTNKLNKIRITEGNETLSLIKENERWQLEDYPTITLVKSKVDAITNQLINTQVSWPVTSTKNSHERFKVSTNSFEKQVEFTDIEGHKQTLLLGKSPSFKQLYARNLADDDVYSIGYSPYQINVDPDNWLDKTMLSIDSIKEISHSLVNLTKNEDSWQLAPPSALDKQLALNESSVEDFVNQLTNLSVSGIANKAPNATNTLTVTNDQNTQYVFSFAADEENYFVKRGDISQWFTLAKPKYEALANLSLDKFISEQSPQEEKDSDIESE